jgi:hypothetical protein
MKMRNLKEARAVAKVARAEFYIVLALLLLLGAFAVPAHAATERSASFYNLGLLQLQGAYQAAETPSYEQPKERNVMVRGSYDKPLTKDTNLYMSGGVGLDVKEHVNYTASDRTEVAPAYRVAMGIKCRF